MTISILLYEQEDMLSKDLENVIQYPIIYANYMVSRKKRKKKQLIFFSLWEKASFISRLCMPGALTAYFFFQRSPITCHHHASSLSLYSSPLSSPLFFLPIGHSSLFLFPSLIFLCTPHSLPTMVFGCNQIFLSVLLLFFLRTTMTIFGCYRRQEIKRRGKERDSATNLRVNRWLWQVRI